MNTTHDRECMAYRSLYRERYAAHYGRRQPSHRICICTRDHA